MALTIWGRFATGVECDETLRLMQPSMWGFAAGAVPPRLGTAWLSGRIRRIADARGLVALAALVLSFHGERSG